MVQTDAAVEAQVPAIKTLVTEHLAATDPRRLCYEQQ